VCIVLQGKNTFTGSYLSIDNVCVFRYMMTLLAMTITFSHKYSQTVACCHLRRLRRNIILQRTV